jgi:hypothetical protein
LGDGATRTQAQQQGRKRPPTYQLSTDRHPSHFAQAGDKPRPPPLRLICGGVYRHESPKVLTSWPRPAPGNLAVGVGCLEAESGCSGVGACSGQHPATRRVQGLKALLPRKRPPTRQGARTWVLLRRGRSTNLCLPSRAAHAISACSARDCRPLEMGRPGYVWTTTAMLRCGARCLMLLSELRLHVWDLTQPSAGAG